MATEGFPKTEFIQHRFDFRGGLNRSDSVDNLSQNVLSGSTNVRLNRRGTSIDSIGALTKMGGTRRMHTTAIGSGNAITGLQQWDAPGGKQIVAIANGRLYHKTSETGDFTEEVPAPLFSTTGRQDFAAMRSSAAGAALKLYIADPGGLLYEWDGSTLTRRDGVNSVPAADLITVFHTRLWAREPTRTKHVYWGVVGDPTDFTTGTGTSGGLALVNIASGEDITALDVIGNALFIATDDSIAVMRGYSNEDIQLAQDTESLSPDLGCLHHISGKRVGVLYFFMTDRGPYVAGTQGVRPLGLKVRADFQDFLENQATLVSPVEYHRQNEEIWWGCSTDGTNIDAVEIYSLLTNSWITRYEFSDTLTTLARWENPSTGREWLMGGFSDGFVRRMELGTTLDETVAGGDGSGAAFTASIDFPVHFGNGPVTAKLLEELVVQAVIPSGSDLTFTPTLDGTAGSDITISGSSNNLQPYVVDPEVEAARFHMTFTWTDAAINLFGFTFTADELGRPIS